MHCVPRERPCVWRRRFFLQEWLQRPSHQGGVPCWRGAFRLPVFRCVDDGADRDERGLSQEHCSDLLRATTDASTEGVRCGQLEDALRLWVLVGGWIRGPYWYDDMGMVASGSIDAGVIVSCRFRSFPFVSSFRFVCDASPWLRLQSSRIWHELECLRQRQSTIRSPICAGETAGAEYYQAWDCGNALHRPRKVPFPFA